MTAMIGGLGSVPSITKLHEMASEALNNLRQGANDPEANNYRKGLDIILSSNFKPEEIQKHVKHREDWDGLMQWAKELSLK
jgi:hypothetical protein